MQPIVVAELKSFVRELKTQLDTLYHQFAPLPVPPADDEQLREKLNRLYIGASSVQKTVGGSSSTGLSSAVAGASYSCEASHPNGKEGSDLQGLSHSNANPTSNGAGPCVPNDIHVSGNCSCVSVP